MRKRSDSIGSICGTLRKDAEGGSEVEMLTITEAAAAAGVSDRTLRKYDRAGRVSRVEGPDGRPRYRRDEVEALRWVPNGAEADRKESEVVGSPAAEGVGTDRKHLSPPDSSALLVESLQAHVATLTAELDRRAEEAARQAVAEEQLRVMLMQLERTNAELAASLCVKALPPASEPAPPPKVRWWVQLWRRKV